MGGGLAGAAERRDFTQQKWKVAGLMIMIMTDDRKELPACCCTASPRLVAVTSFAKHRTLFAGDLPDGECTGVSRLALGAAR